MGLRRTELGLKTGRPIRDAEVAGSNPVASTLHVQGFRETETLNFFLKVDVSLTFL